MENSRDSEIIASARKVGCLVIHGFGGSVYEVQPLVERLLELEFKVLAPILKGHTGNRDALKEVSYMDWIQSAETQLHQLLACCETVYIIGFSMGGLIAVNLALKYPVSGIATINTPIYYWNLKRILANIGSDLIKKAGKRDYHRIRSYIKSSGKLPFKALLNFNALLVRTKPMLNSLLCPIFVAQAINDDTVRKSSADYLFKHARSDVKRLEFYDSASHLIFRSKEGDNVSKHIVEFLQELNKKASNGLVNL